MNDRQQQLISLLCQRRSDSIQNLAMELGVCERTIRRDIEELTLTYPIETVRGRYGGGVRMADWYFQDRPKLTPKQTALLKRLCGEQPPRHHPQGAVLPGTGGDDPTGQQAEGDAENWQDGAGQILGQIRPLRAAGVRGVRNAL